MIEAYFFQIEAILYEFPTIRSYTLRKKVYNIKQGFINGSIVFENEYMLDFVEVKDAESSAKLRELEENNIRISCRTFVRLQGVMTGA